MNFLAAQCKKDFVPLRGLMFGMAALLALSVVFRLLEATGAVRISGSPVGALQFILVAVLIVRLIHLDALTDPHAFWRTRPIPRSQLLLAKAVFLSLPILALLALSQPWNGTKDLETMFPFLAATAAFASVTKTFSKTVLLALKMVFFALFATMIIGIVLIPVSLALQNLHLLPWPQLQPPSGAVKLNLGVSGTALSLGVNILAFAGYVIVVVFQYRTLQTRLSVRAIFGILLFTALVSSLAAEIAD